MKVKGVPMRKLLLLLHDRRATTAIEYSLIAGGIAVAISVIVFAVGTDLKGLFQSIGTMVGKF